MQKRPITTLDDAPDAEHKVAKTSDGAAAAAITLPWLPIDVLKLILKQVSWRYARPVCRAWRALSPLPELARRQIELTQSTARIVWMAQQSVAAACAGDTRFVEGPCDVSAPLRDVIATRLKTVFGKAPPRNVAELRAALQNRWFWFTKPMSRDGVLSFEVSDLQLDCRWGYVSFYVKMLANRSAIGHDAAAVTVRDAAQCAALELACQESALLNNLDVIPRIFHEQGCQLQRDESRAPMNKFWAKTLRGGLNDATCRLLCGL